VVQARNGDDDDFHYDFSYFILVEYAKVTVLLKFQSFRFYCKRVATIRCANVQYSCMLSVVVLRSCANKRPIINKKKYLKL